MAKEIKIVGLAGGTGAGKSTLAKSLAKKYKSKISILHLDDYFRVFEKDKIPKYRNMIMWDHPEAIDFVTIVEHLNKVKKGKSFDWITKHYSDDTHRKTNVNDVIKRIPYTFVPKEVVLLEGFLSGYDEKVRDNFDCFIFLDAPEGVRLKRRIWFADEYYFKDVLQPMQEKYVYPTKKFADKVIDVGSRTEKEVFTETENFLIEKGIL